MAKARICTAWHSKGKAKNRYDAKSKGIAGKSDAWTRKGSALVSPAVICKGLAQSGVAKALRRNEQQRLGTAEHRKELQRQSIVCVAMATIGTEMQRK